MNKKLHICHAERDLSESQRIPAQERSKRVVLTAGAGSGKTRTLVARYMGLLAEGFQPDEVVAITFTEKAAREMRARIRNEVQKEKLTAVDALRKQFWQSLEQKMEGARIGTIHSLCSEILRNHPAEAGLDPEFTVLEEALSLVERMNAIQTTMGEMLNDSDLRALYRLLKIKSLSDLLKETLALRLEVGDWVNDPFADGHHFLPELLEVWFTQEDCREIVHSIMQLSGEFLQQDTTAKGCDQVLAFQRDWNSFEELYAEGDYCSCFNALGTIRKAHHKGIGSKTSRSFELMSAWFNFYDQNWKLMVDVSPIDAQLEALYFEAIRAVKRMIVRAEEIYLDNLRRQQNLDFDDLEQMALAVLTQPAVAAIWQRKVAALLVDEFQDTNNRQQQIVEILCGSQPEKLFVVGDTCQSIYRFRGADVSIFRNLEIETEKKGGMKCALMETYRTHTTLLAGMNALLGSLMQNGENAENPYLVPFIAMNTKKEKPDIECKTPFIELLIGAGENAEKGRQNSASLLARRLRDLKDTTRVDWKDIVLLFRASTTFVYYEHELEKAGIPFVTVAGRGFYDRPEIRDLLNILTALADPWDDLSMIGLLRSPAIGMSDVGITQLRWVNGTRQPAALYLALGSELSSLSILDQAAAERARNLFTTFQPAMGCKPVSEILQQLVVFTRYQAILAGATERAWRNVEKLLADSATNRFYSVHAYLEYVAQINDSGAREGEAPAEAEEAVRLMTIHKAKGLEFPVVVLADIGRRANNQKGQWIHLADQGAAFKPGRLEYSPLAWRLMVKKDQVREKAEDQRLLYVAMTRAKDMLIFNGHVTSGKRGLRVEGWLKDIAEVLQIDFSTLEEEGGEILLNLAGNCQLKVSMGINNLPDSYSSQPKASPKMESVSGLIEPLCELEWLPQTKISPILSDELQPLVGNLLHQALETWFFPVLDQERQILVNWAYQQGYYNSDQITPAVELVCHCLRRLANHPLFHEIDHAEQKMHEIPYAIEQSGQFEAGRVDLLFKTKTGWHLLDFKSDHLKTLADCREEVLSEYRQQLRRYANVVQQLVGEVTSARICFLNAGDQLELLEVDL